MFSSRQRPLGIELVTFIYTLFTSLLICFLWNRMDNPLRLLESRAVVLGCMGIIYAIYRAQPNRYTLYPQPKENKPNVQT